MPPVEILTDVPFAVVIDAEAPRGNVLAPLARLLLAVGRRRHVEACTKASAGEETVLVVQK